MTAKMVPCIAGTYKYGHNIQKFCFRIPKQWKLITQNQYQPLFCCMQPCSFFLTRSTRQGPLTTIVYIQKPIVYRHGQQYHTIISPQNLFKNSKTKILFSFTKVPYNNFISLNPSILQDIISNKGTLMCLSSPINSNGKDKANICQKLIYSLIDSFHSTVNPQADSGRETEIISVITSIGVRKAPFL